MPPSRPRKWTKRVAEWEFWSEDGKGRDDWLREFRVLLQEENIPFRDDDGWRWFDVEVYPYKQVSGSVGTVTEYHGGQRCLTRIALMSRVHRTSVMTVAGLLLLSLLPAHPLVSVPLRAAACLMLAVHGFAWWFYSDLVKKLVLEAAQRAGLQPARSRDIPVPKAGGHSCPP